MRVYHERLRAPATWWLTGLAVVIVLGTELVAGFGWPVALGLYAVVGGVCAAMLMSWGRATVTVTGGELRAGRRRLPLADAGEVTALDAAQTRALRGPRADPAAFMLVRPYLTKAVYIEVAGHGDAAPYWLIATRHPVQLAAAIESARQAERPGGSLVG